MLKINYLFIDVISVVLGFLLCLGMCLIGFNTGNLLLPLVLSCLWLLFQTEDDYKKLRLSLILLTPIFFYSDIKELAAILISLMFVEMGANRKSISYVYKSVVVLSLAIFFISLSLFRENSIGFLALSILVTSLAWPYNFIGSSRALRNFILMLLSLICFKYSLASSELAYFVAALAFINLFNRKVLVSSNLIFLSIGLFKPELWTIVLIAQLLMFLPGYISILRLGVFYFIIPELGIANPLLIAALGIASIEYAKIDTFNKNKLLAHSFASLLILSVIGFYIYYTDLLGSFDQQSLSICLAATLFAILFNYIRHLNDKKAWIKIPVKDLSEIRLKLNPLNLESFVLGYEKQIKTVKAWSFSTYVYVTMGFLMIGMWGGICFIS